MLYSVEDYGIDIEFSMLTVGCLQLWGVFKTQKMFLKNDCDLPMPIEKGGREKNLS